MTPEQAAAAQLLLNLILGASGVIAAAWLIAAVWQEIRQRHSRGAR